MKPTITLALFTLFLIASSTLATEPAPKPDQVKHSKDKSSNKNGDGSGANGGAGGVGGIFGPGGGINIPGLGNGFGNGIIGGGYGSGYGGSGGGSSGGGTIRPTVVCKDRGPCFQKKVTCPAKCFTSFSHSGKGYGAGGGGGGCTIDCKKKCVGYC